MKVRLTVAVAVLTFVAARSVCAKTGDQYQVRTTSGTLVTVRVTSKSGPEEGTVPAKLCVHSGEKTGCYEAVTEHETSLLGPFSLEPSYAPVRYDDGDTIGWLLFSAKTVPFTSRQDHMLALLVLSSSLQLSNVLPPVILSEQSEYSLWRDKRLSPMPILTTADYLFPFESEETHFSAHHYRVQTYMADASGKYRLVDDYKTARKYPGLDTVDKIQVLEGERETFRSHLLSKSRGAVPSPSPK